ncbi:MAG: twin-arginine translocase TatA/TatE family subunit [Acidobacteria bacterium]|nr:twin-arginine translocase TatA/TatE family subunit [Acidobacteriota bacterium]
MSMSGFILPNVGMTELIVILVILLLLFGGRRLPELAKGLGQSIKAFKQATTEAQLEDKGGTSAVSSQPSASNRTKETPGSEQDAENTG